MYAAIAIAALGTSVITTTATTQVTYADNGIGNDLDNDGDNECGTNDTLSISLESIWRIGRFTTEIIKHDSLEAHS